MKKGSTGTANRNLTTCQSMLLKTRIAIIGEGAGGSLCAELQKEFGLLPEGVRREYETGVKEVWQYP